MSEKATPAERSHTTVQTIDWSCTIHGKLYIVIGVPGNVHCSACPADQQSLRGNGSFGQQIVVEPGLLSVMSEPQPAAREYSREELEHASSPTGPFTGSVDLREAIRALLTERDRLTTALVTLADGYKLKAPLPSPEIQDAIRVARAAGAEGENA